MERIVVTCPQGKVRTDYWREKVAAFDGKKGTWMSPHTFHTVLGGSFQLQKYLFNNQLKFEVFGR